MGSDGTEKEVECGVGDLATVWDGEIAGMAEGIARVPRDGRKALVLADSKAAIAGGEEGREDWEGEIPPPAEVSE